MNSESILAGVGINYPRDIRMIHQCQGLAFGIKSGNDFPRVHPPLNHFQRYQPMDGLLLFSQIHRAHSTPSQQAERFVRPVLPAYIFLQIIIRGFGHRFGFPRPPQETSRRGTPGKQVFAGRLLAQQRFNFAFQI
jgi:hypothetical protein